MSAETQLALHEERLSRHRVEIKEASGRITTLEEDRHQRELDRIGDQNLQKEMSADIRDLKGVVEKAVEGIEKVDKRIDERLTAIEVTVSETKKGLVEITSKIKNIERSERFSIVKVVRWIGKWLYTWYGTFFLCFVFLIMVGVFNPGAQDFILDMLGIATKAKLP